MTPELIHIPRSHFNEKARWGFDLKGVPHVRTSVVAGTQRRMLRRLTGQPEVPVARFGDEYVVGSARILEAIESRFPDPPLYPGDPDERARALAIQERFDEQVGARVRRAVFSIALDHPEFWARLFASHVGAPRRAVYRAVVTVRNAQIRHQAGLTAPGAVDDAFAATERALDFVAGTAGADGYLVGERFSIADLAAAALLALTVETEHPDMTWPRPRPAAVDRWHERWSDHPGAAWVRSMYERHRPQSHAIG